MNATQDASNQAQNKINRQLIEYNEKQNDLIFKTRSRLFKLEHNFRILILVIGITGINVSTDWIGGDQWLMVRSLKYLTMLKSMVSLSVDVDHGTKNVSIGLVNH